MRTPFKIALRIAFRRLKPGTRTALFTFYLAGVELFLLALMYGLRFGGAQQAAATLVGWIRGLFLAICALLLFLALRWFRSHLMWRVRNRLIVTYLFIGGVPIFLVVMMALIAGYFLTGEFATYLTVSEIQSQMQELQAANVETSQQVVRSKPAKSGAAPQQQVKITDAVFPNRTVLVLPEGLRPKWLKDGFNGLVQDQGQVYIRAVNMVRAGDRQLAVVSSVPVDTGFLGKIAAGLGPVTLYVLGSGSGNDIDVQVTPSEGVVIHGNTGRGISAGLLPEPRFHGDRALSYYALIQPTTAWDSGQVSNTLLVGSARLSTLYSRLSVSLNQWADIVRILLTALAITFAVIVLIALLIGIRLTRTVTRSVANLYEATEHVNRGDFSHRIAVKEHDQLATLQVAFNSMTESLEKLIADQKEKERLQSELAIAQEVQAQLFPKLLSGTQTLELHGVCRPARIVSGDYYDFLPYGSEQIGIAVGDISGKGISAALLMATIHSAVRAYEQEQLIAVSARPYPRDPQPSGSVGIAIRHSPPQSPSQVLWLLNRQLYKTTQPEKYATLFLGFYDGQTRQLTYSNAGHLPPLILGANGSVRRLETGGTVVGLFENTEYDESTVQLCPGDIFVAFSDGITEPENEFGEFGEERLIETIQTNRHLPLDRITDNVIAAIQDWIGSAEQPDDITVVLARPRS
ncbi:MAG TPA: PP2C family protein-serine/threonine phosphatase [Candidatus Angelobacter sp.]